MTEPFSPDAPTYSVQPLPVSALAAEFDRARGFWQGSPTNLYYHQFQPQTLLLIHLLRSIRAKSVLEFGCNVSRNLYWIRRFVPDIRVLGVDINADAVMEGRAHFGFTADELQVADDSRLATTPTASHDAVFTVSVLDHLPEAESSVRHMLRIARKRVILIELVLPRFGRIDDPRCIDCSYSHDYRRLLARLPCRLVTHAPCPLGEGILEHYQLFEVEPRAAWRRQLTVQRLFAHPPA